MEELLSLKWNNHKSTFIHVLGVLRDKQLYTDATIACEGKFYNVHKLVLSTCSDYFSAMLDRTNCKKPVIVLKDIKCEDLEALLDYMYIGEVNVRQCDLATLIKAAECLRVKGLAVPDDEPPPQQRKNRDRRDSSLSSPPAKRKRRAEVEDGRDDVRNVIIKSDISNSNMRPIPRAKSPPLVNHISPIRTSHKVQPIDSPKVIETNNSENNCIQPEIDLPSSNKVYVEEIPETFVKQEVEDGIVNNTETFDISNDEAFKEEGDDGHSGHGGESGGDLSNDLPEFLQQASSGAAFGHSSFTGNASFQAGDLAGWQSDGQNMTFPPFNLGSSEGSSQNNPGSVAAEEKNMGPYLECTQCGKKCYGRNRKQNLAHHSITHNNERNVACKHCPYRASSSSQLMRHLSQLHPYAFNMDPMELLRNIQISRTE